MFMLLLQDDRGADVIGEGPKAGHNCFVASALSMRLNQVNSVLDGGARGDRHEWDGRQMNNNVLTHVFPFQETLIRHLFMDNGTVDFLQTD